MLSIRQMSRYKAAAMHLAISATIAAAVLSIMLALWYPPPLFKAMGGMELIVLIVGVDIAIGPLITLIIFNPQKKELLFDLSVVAVLQLAALLYGSYAMHSGRPVFTVFTGENFAVVAAVEIDDVELVKGRTETFRQRSLLGPQLVAVKQPTDTQELNDIAFAALGGMGIQHLPKHYVPYTEQRSKVVAQAKPIADLSLERSGDKDKLDAYLARSGRPSSSLRCLPVATKFLLLTAIVDAESGDLLELLDIVPTIKKP